MCEVHTTFRIEDRIVHAHGGSEGSVSKARLEVKLAVNAMPVLVVRDSNDSDCETETFLRRTEQACGGLSTAGKSKDLLRCAVSGLCMASPKNASFALLCTVGKNRKSKLEV